MDEVKGKVEPVAWLKEHDQLGPSLHRYRPAHIPEREWNEAYGVHALVPATTLATLQSAIAEKDAEIARLQAERDGLSPELTSTELKLIDKHCDWAAFKPAFNAIMKHRARPALTGESDG
jgi:hypothetical protein